MGEGEITSEHSLPERPKPETIVKFEKAARSFKDAHIQQPLDNGRTLLIAYYPTPDPDGKITPRPDKREFTFVGEIDSDPGEDGLYSSNEIRVVRGEDGVALQAATVKYRKDSHYNVFYLHRTLDDKPDIVLTDRIITEADLQKEISRMEAIQQDEDVTSNSDTLVNEPTDVKSDPHRRKKRFHRAVAAGLAAATLGGILTYGLSTQSQGDSNTVGIERSVDVKRYPPESLEAKVAALEKNRSVMKGAQTTDLGGLQSRFTEGDFKLLVNPAGDGEQKFAIKQGEIPTAQVFEVTYDKATNSLSSKSDITNIDDNTMYHLLAPVVNNTVLKTALAEGKIDRVVIDLNQTDEFNQYGGFADVLSGTFMNDDRTEAQKGTQKTLFLFLPNKTLNTTEYRVALTHESLHALISGSGLSGYNKNHPSMQEFAQWQDVCKSVRTIAIDQAEQHSKELLTPMEANLKHFKNPEIRAVFHEVLSALQRGDFNKFQEKSPDYTSAFANKVPNCDTIGPWDAFEALLKAKKIHYEPESEYIGNLQEVLTQKWNEILSNDTIYQQLREGPYSKETGARNNLAGHPFQDWDEAVVSINNLIILYPKLFGDTIKKLPLEEKVAALKLINTAVDIAGALVPKDQLNFHILQRTHYALFTKEVTS